MYWLTVNLTSSEWMRDQTARRKAGPKECLSGAEIVRRYTLFGMEALKTVSPADQARLAHQFQSSTTAGDTLLKS